MNFWVFGGFGLSSRLGVLGLAETGTPPNPVPVAPLGMAVLVPKELRPPKRVGTNVALGWEPYGGLPVPNTGLKSVLSDAELPAAATPCLAETPKNEVGGCLDDSRIGAGTVDVTPWWLKDQRIVTQASAFEGKTDLESSELFQLPGKELSREHL